MKYPKVMKYMSTPPMVEFSCARSYPDSLRILRKIRKSQKNMSGIWAKSFFLNYIKTLRRFNCRGVDQIEDTRQPLERWCQALTPIPLFFLSSINSSSTISTMALTFQSLKDPRAEGFPKSKCGGLECRLH
jgi:hypothetical protein